MGGKGGGAHEGPNAKILTFFVESFLISIGSHPSVSVVGSTQIDDQRSYVIDNYVVIFKRRSAQVFLLKARQLLVLVDATLFAI